MSAGRKGSLSLKLQTGIMLHSCFPADAAAAAAEAARAEEEAEKQAAKDEALLIRQQELIDLSAQLLADGRALKEALGSEPFQRVFSGFRAKGCGAAGAMSRVTGQCSDLVCGTEGHMPLRMQVALHCHALHEGLQSQNMDGTPDDSICGQAGQQAGQATGNHGAQWGDHAAQPCICDHQGTQTTVLCMHAMFICSFP